MAAPKGNKFAQGNNGGRKSFRDETVINAVIKKMWDWLDQRWDRFDDKQKMDAVLRICPKTIPEQHEHSGSVIFKIIDKTNGNGDNDTIPISTGQSAEVSGGSLERPGEVQGSNPSS